MHTTLLPLSILNHFPYNYGSKTFIPPPPTTNCVLDLSVKSRRRETSPDYTYCYPSPKTSPCFNQTIERCDSAKCCSESKDSDMKPVREEADTSPYPLASPKTPRSPGMVSETSETSFQSDTTGDRSPKSSKKTARPFKVLGKDSITLSVDAIKQLNSAYSVSPLFVDEAGLNPEQTKHLMEESAKRYREYREKMMIQLRNNTTNTNENMRRPQNNSNRFQDVDYLERRRKNNEAAKRSRDARRYKQDEIAIRARFLEQEYVMLKYKLKSEMDDLERLRKLEGNAEMIS